MVDEEGNGIVLAPVEDGLTEGEIVVEDESEEEAPDLKHATDIASPSKEQIEKHRVCHFPYRSWCKWCIMGRGIGRPHTTSAQKSTVPIVGMDYFYITKGGVRRRTELAKELDAVLGAHGAPASEALRRGNEVNDDVATSSALDADVRATPAATDPSSAGGVSEEAITTARSAGAVVKCLLVRCFHSKNVFAHVIPQKGDDEDHYCAKLAVADIEWLGHTKVIIKTDNERAIVALKHRVAKHLKEWNSMDNVQTESPVA